MIGSDKAFKAAFENIGICIAVSRQGIFVYLRKRAFRIYYTAHMLSAVANRLKRIFRNIY